MELNRKICSNFLRHKSYTNELGIRTRRQFNQLASNMDIIIANYLARIVSEYSTNLARHSRER